MFSKKGRKLEQQRISGLDKKRHRGGLSSHLSNVPLHKKRRLHGHQQGQMETHRTHRTECRPMAGNFPRCQRPDHASSQGIRIRRPDHMLRNLRHHPNR